MENWDFCISRKNAFYRISGVRLEREVSMGENLWGWRCWCSHLAAHVLRGRRPWQWRAGVVITDPRHTPCFIYFWELSLQWKSKIRYASLECPPQSSFVKPVINFIFFFVYFYVHQFTKSILSYFYNNK